mmetsp:Transcript_43355/g.139319  ORF Transcript_43355/g.139319 Transcript_43355/m.139319 type:complete len:292 (-) Transcript_43355:64-939(-)
MVAPLHSTQALETVRLEAELFTTRLEAAGAIGVKRPVCIRARADAGSGRCPQQLGDGEQRLHLVRHGQGFHNLLADLYHELGRKFDAASGEGGEQNPYCRREVVAPPLTEVGRIQARALQQRAQTLKPDLVVVSPLARATQTALLAFSHLLEPAVADSRVHFVAHEGCHEIAGVHTCDRRRCLSELRREFPMVDYDSASVQEEDPFWSETVREPLPQLAQRGYEFLLWIRSRPERDIVVASHFAWLFTLSSAVLHCDDASLKAGFLTGEMRSIIVRFEDVPEPSAKRARTD